MQISIANNISYLSENKDDGSLILDDEDPLQSHHVTTTMKQLDPQGR